MPILALLAGPFGRFALYAAAAIALFGAAWFALHEHDQRILAEQAARESAAIAAQQLADARAALDAVQAEAQASAARARTATTIKTEIARAPATVACAASPAVRAAIDGLRNPAGAGAAAAGSPAVPADLRPGAGAARPPPR